MQESTVICRWEFVIDRYLNEKTERKRLTKIDKDESSWKLDEVDFEDVD